MNVRSLGYRTDLIFAAFNGQVIDRGDHLVVRTPSNPTFYWGNFLLFEMPPQKGDFERWRRLFAAEIGAFPTVRHETFGWDVTSGEVGEVAPFLNHGFKLGRSTVLAATELRPPEQPAAGLLIRPLETQEDWRLALENQVLCRETAYEEAGYREFKERQMPDYRSMSAAGHGAWFGAFSDGDLVADLGIFHDGTVARYQNVETHPGHRRQGIAGSLVYHAGQYALTNFGVETLVIVADHESAASRLYRSLAFDPRELQVGLERDRNSDILKTD